MTKPDAGQVFDQVIAQIFKAKRQQFVNGQLPFSNETEESLEAKAAIIKQRMAEGREFRNIIDDADIFIGSEDADFVYKAYIEGWYQGTLEDHRKDRLLLQARRELSDLSVAVQYGQYRSA